METKKYLQEKFLIKHVVLYPSNGLPRTYVGVYKNPLTNELIIQLSDLPGMKPIEPDSFPLMEVVDTGEPNEF